MPKLTPNRIRSVAGRRLMRRRHTAMLCAILAFFAVRPLIGDGPTASVLFTAALLALMILALLAIQIDELVGEQDRLRAERRRNWIVGGILASVVIGLRLLIAYLPSANLTLLWELFVMSFMSFVTWNELRAVLRQKEITGESISMAISVYLLIGLTWSLLYDVIYQLQPNAFSLNGTASSLVAQGHPIFPVLGYFSFITLTTIGYGDIAPVTLQARYAALVEGVTGQFYLAILVARLVSMQLVQISSRDK
jgi:voltage-gated potassium channel